MANELQLMKKQIRDNIQFLIDDNKLDEAMSLIDDYFKIDSEDIEIYSMRAVVFIMQGNMKDAQEVLKQGLAIDGENFDLNYNLAYLYKQEERFNEALNHYEKALENCKDENIKADITTIVDKIASEHHIVSVEDKKKIVFFVKQGMDSFLGDIINGLSDEYETKKIIVTDYKQIDEGMQWADICWFEWCDELIIYGSNLQIAKEKKIMCRLHSYEAFTDYPLQVNWDNVDKFIFDTRHIKDIVLEKVNIDMEKILLIPVGVDTNKFTFKHKKNGFNVAYVGYINYKKGPMLLIQLISALVKKDKRYKLFIGGQFQDERDVLYFNQMIKEMNLENNLEYSGWVDNVNEWLEDKDYIISTSLLEGQHLSVMEGMCKGIKPIVHNFVGAKQVYDKKYVWNTIDEAVEMIASEVYFSMEYRNYIVNNYDNKELIEKIKVIFEKEVPLYKKTIIKKKPLVTIGIPNYNYCEYLDFCLDSILQQDYKNVEIIIVDDCSTDNSKQKIKEYTNKYKNVKAIFHKINSGGCFIANNEVIKMAKGEYLIMLSADDCLAYKHVLTYMVNEFEKDVKLDYLYGDFKIIDKEGNSSGKWEYRQFNDDEIVRETFKRGGSGIMPLTAGMYNMKYFKNKNLIWKNYGRNVVGWDTLNTLINIKNNLSYKYVSTELIAYRQHNNNMTFNIKERVWSLISNVEYLINNFKKEIYSPEIEWKKIELKEKNSVIYYIIGCKYYELFMIHYNNNWNPFDGKLINTNKEEVLCYLKPFVDMIKKYFVKSLKENSIYKKEIIEINENIEHLYK